MARQIREPAATPGMRVTYDTNAADQAQLPSMLAENTTLLSSCLPVHAVPTLPVFNPGH